MSELTKEQRPESKQRWRLSILVTIISMLGISLIAGLAIGFADDKDATSQMVLTAVLPILAAWVGTVLAYYYSSESIESATQSVKDLIPTEERLKSTAVAEVMRKIHNMVTYTYTADEKVKDILNKVKTANKGDRLPFLDDENKPLYMLHKSAINDALIERSIAGDDIADLTLKDLFDRVKGFQALAQNSFGIISEKSTLADAKAKMQSIDRCQDVFVTENGGRDEPVIGWITNNIIDQYSRVT